MEKLKNKEEEKVEKTVLAKVIELSKSVELGKRDNWDQYFMSQAYMTSMRSTCGSRRVGAVIVRDKRIISTGYNGYPSGGEHCVDGGCPRYKAKLEGKLDSGQYTNEFPCWAQHAEANALYQCLNEGISTKNAVLYTTTFPCIECAKKILGAGIKKFYYVEGYPDKTSEQYLETFGVTAIKIAPDYEQVIL